MQKVWEELKSVEVQAKKIQTAAQEKSKAIIAQAQKDAEQLLANSNAYAEEEFRKRHAAVVEEANQIRNKQIVDNEETSARLKANADKHMGKAVKAILDAIIEEI